MEELKGDREEEAKERNRERKRWRNGREVEKRKGNRERGREMEEW